MLYVSIGKPQQRGRCYRCLVNISGSRFWGPTSRTPGGAEKLAAVAAQEAAHGALTVKDALGRYRLYLVEHKGNKACSVENTRTKLERFFSPVLPTLLAELTPRRAAALYEDLRTTPSERTGKPLAVDSHRQMLAEAKSFGRWCEQQQLWPKSPLCDVQGVGRRRHGKPQPRIDEARRIRNVAHGLAAEGDDGAVAVLVDLLMALRASEITLRVVRDLDDDGRVLWVPDAKTEAGKRRAEVPEELQDYLRERARGRLPLAPLFPSKTGGHHWRDWVSEQTRRICELAGAPEFCAHSLRGFAATVGMQSGALPHLVARELGHVSPSTTFRSYALPGSEQIAQQKTAIRVLDGGK